MRSALLAVLSLLFSRVAGQSDSVTVERLQGSGWTLGLATTGRTTEAPLVLLIHGSPGSWQDMKTLLTQPELTSHTRVRAVDRPGYGLSGSEPVTSLEEQARRIGAVLQAEGKPVILVGHSLGGPIALAIAALYPQLVSAVVIVAGSADPSLENIRWFQHVAQWPLIRSLIPRPLYVCNEEMMVQPKELLWLQAKLSTIQLPITIVQGEKDDLVPPGNVDYLQRQLTRATLTIQRYPKLNHFIPFMQPKLVVEAITPYLKPR